MVVWWRCGGGVVAVWWWCAGCRARGVERGLAGDGKRVRALDVRGFVLVVLFPVVGNGMVFPSRVFRSLLSGSWVGGCVGMCLNI